MENQTNLLPKHSSHLSIFLALLSLLLLLYTIYLAYQNTQLQKQLAPLLLYSRTPTPTPTDNLINWKTYTDSQQNFSFRYPSDWAIDKEQIFGSRTEIDFTYNRTTTLALSIITNYNNETGKPFKSLEEYIGQRIPKARDITVDSFKGKLIIDPGEEGHVLPYQEAVLFPPNNTNILSLYYQAAYYENPQADQVLDQILSTFRFLE